MIGTERVIPVVLWLALLGYALLLAPPAAPDTFDQALAMLLLDSGRADPIAIAIFNLLGVLPAAFMALILFDTGRPNPWLFALDRPAALAVRLPLLGPLLYLALRADLSNGAR